jgi:Fe-S-cluster containining protein
MRPRQTSTPDSNQAGLSLGSTLCTQCGLCCSGALHNWVALEPYETSIAEDLGLKVTVSDRPRFALPCPKLSGCACSIYENRPKVCRRYKCQLLEEIEQGVTDLPTAVGKVHYAKHLINDIERQLPAGVTLPDARVHCLGNSEQTQRGHDFMSLKLAVTALCLYIDKHFKNDRESKFMSVESRRRAENPLEMK